MVTSPGFKLAVLLAHKTMSHVYELLARTIDTHFALIVSLRPGHNVSIKIVSIEKAF